jgi:tetratricopeptide (TPR) repeat protein
MGELLARTGKTSRALENYRMGAADSLALVTLMPWDCYHQSRLAASHGKIGDILAKMGKHSEAAAEYQSALEIAKPLASAKPRNPLPWYIIADAYSGLGGLSRIVGRPVKWKSRMIKKFVPVAALSKNSLLSAR